MKVEILTVPECPNLRPACDLVQEVLAREGVRAEVKVTVVRLEETAGVTGFAGSPTILVNGRDVEPDSAEGVCCRLYASGRGVPSQAAIAQAIRAAVVQEAPCKSR